MGELVDQWGWRLAILEGLEPSQPTRVSKNIVVRSGRTGSCRLKASVDDLELEHVCSTQILQK